MCSVHVGECALLYAYACEGQGLTFGVFLNPLLPMILGQGAFLSPELTIMTCLSGLSVHRIELSLAPGLGLEAVTAEGISHKQSHTSLEL